MFATRMEERSDHHSFLSSLSSFCRRQFSDSLPVDAGGGGSARLLHRAERGAVRQSGG